jgi:uncharacterized membrane protein YfcA
MEILGYICALLVGVSLGAIGSGGSILTVPVFVYLFRVAPLMATGYSLLVVGITSSVGVTRYLRDRLVDIRTAVIFAIPSLVSVFITLKFIVPAIPDPVFTTTTYILSKDVFIMYVFALLVLASAYTMIRNSKLKEPDIAESARRNYPLLIGIGLACGFLTGLIAVGGGFIIIPALVIVARLPVKMSVGTSLLIITANAFIGFAGEAWNSLVDMNYSLVLLFCICSVTGIFIGSALAKQLRPGQLKKIFGWFVFVIGVSIFIKEIFMK